MAGPGLFDPLGMGSTVPAARKDRRPVWAAAAGLAACAGAALAGHAWPRDDVDRGRPFVTVPITYAAAAPVPPAPPPAPPAAVPAPDRSADVSPVSFGAPPAAFDAPPPTDVPPPSPSPRLTRDDQEVEVQNGVRVIRPRRDRAAADGANPRPPADRAALR